MADILFIKTSSLGDVVHQMPAIGDARRHLPGARLAWVVEEAYAPLARLHRDVDEVIPVASRRWRASVRRPSAWRETWHEIARFRGAIRDRAYDAVIDTQGLLRTGAIARMARGVRHGYDMASIREPPAALFYDVHHRVRKGVHAILRNRTLCGLALGYAPEPPLEFGLDRAAIASIAGNEPKNYAVLLHATAQPAKQWPQQHWVAVARGVLERGLDAVLPWGTAGERARSLAIAAACESGGSLDMTANGRPKIQVPALRPLDEIAALIAGAAVVVGVDTGLLHVAAALGVPLAAIFVHSEPGLTGPMGPSPIEILGKSPERGATPAPAEPAAVLRALDRLRAS